MLQCACVDFQRFPIGHGDSVRQGCNKNAAGAGKVLINSRSPSHVGKTARGTRFPENLPTITIRYECTRTNHQSSWHFRYATSCCQPRKWVDGNVRRTHARLLIAEDAPGWITRPGVSIARRPSASVNDREPPPPPVASAAQLAAVPTDGLAVSKWIASEVGVPSSETTRMLVGRDVS